MAASAAIPRNDGGRREIAARVIKDEHVLLLGGAARGLAAAGMASTSAFGSRSRQEFVEAHAQGFGDTREGSERRLRLPFLDGDEFVFAYVHARGRCRHRQPLALPEPS